ncbi:MAG: ABC transporter transmembrane domain-containing protein [Anaerolineales bacterium]
MSRFFTNTKSGELMSRLNNDVVGAQNAISNTIVNIVTNLIEAIALLIVMLTMQWQLTHQHRDPSMPIMPRNGSSATHCATLRVKPWRPTRR